MHKLENEIYDVEFIFLYEVMAFWLIVSTLNQLNLQTTKKVAR